jgi:outer membrane protein assembly factor BamB
MAMGAALFLTVCVQADDWPQWRGPNRDGKSEEKGLLRKWPATGPRKLWTIEGLGEGFSTVAVVGDTIYTTGMSDGQGRLYAISTSGKIRGRTTYGDETKGGGYPGPRSTPTVADGRVFIMSGNGVLYCLGAKDGRQIWRRNTFEEFGGRQIGWSVAESVLVDGDRVICTPGGRDAALAALNVKSGQVVWRTGADTKSAYCSPVLVEHNGRRIVLTMVEEGAIAADAKDGRQLWLYPHKNKYAVHAATPVYYKGRVIISSGYGYGSECLEMNREGTRVRKVWENKELANHHGGIIGIEDAVVGTGDRGLVCIDIESGRVNWRDQGVGKGAITYADGLLFMYGERRGEVGLAEVSAKKFGGLTGTFRVNEGTKQHWAHPVVANGVLYIRHGDALSAYKVSE